MFSLNKDTPVVGKAETLVNCSSKDIFSFVGANFIKNYPRHVNDARPIESIRKRRFPTFRFIDS